MQNPIFSLAKSMQNQGNQGNPMLNNSLNQGMNQGMNNNQMMGTGMNNMNMGMNPMMNNMMNQGMNNQMMGTGMNNQMMGTGMNQGMMGTGMNMNPMMNPGMMNMGNMGMMNAAMNMNMMNNNNMANMNNMNTDTGNQSSNGQFISVHFRAGANGENGSIMIQCSLSDKVSDLIEKYRTKSLEDVSQKKFIFNAKNLNRDLTVAEAGLSDGANIFVVNTAGVKGA